MELKQYYSDTIMFKLQSKQDSHLVTHEFECLTWDQALVHFEDFLRGTGYILDGHFELVGKE